MPRAVGSLIRQRRQERGLKVSELAPLVRCSVTHLDNVEAGRKLASIELLHRIAGQLELQIDDLVERRPDTAAGAA